MADSKRDQASAEIEPRPNTVRTPRRPGALQGQILTAPDFEALPADILAAIEGEDDGATHREPRSSTIRS